MADGPSSMVCGPVFCYTLAMHTLRRLWPLWLVVVLIVVAGAFSAWALTGPRADEAALAALGGEGGGGFYGLGYDGLGYEAVAVEQGRWLSFALAGQAPSTGLILYPGARVDPRAYAVAARMLAASGYRVVIVPMPLNLAVLGAGRADDVIVAYPEVTRWAIGGHSLGGAMAALYAYEHPEAIDGLLLWAAYPAASNDLSVRDLPVVSLYGTRDGLATPDKIAASRALLPPDAGFIAIEGGNHAGFGRYGPQAGDLQAEISIDEQQRQVVAGTLALLERISEQ
ncbi:MAG: alpha/beta hydrolase [Anaerolineae bacterium]